MQKKIQEKVGERVKELRKAKGYSQEKLALAAGLDRTYINSVENGRRNISIGSLVKILAALGISLPFFFDKEHYWYLKEGEEWATEN